MNTSYGIASCQVALGKHAIVPPESPGMRLFRLGGDKSVDLELTAARACLEVGRTRPEEIDLILCYSAIPEYTIPGNAGTLQGLLGARSAVALNFEAGCASFVFGVALAEGMGRQQGAENVLLVLSHTLSDVIDTDRQRYSDAAAAVLLRRGHRRRVIRDVLLRTFGDRSRASVVRRKSLEPWYASTDAGFELTGYGDPEFKQFHLESLPNVARDIVARNELSMERDVRAVFLHQSAFTRRWFDMLGVGGAYAPHAYDELGSCGAANIPLLLSRTLEQSDVPEGALALCATVGVGWQAASMLLQW